MDRDVLRGSGRISDLEIALQNQNSNRSPRMRFVRGLLAPSNEMPLRGYSDRSLGTLELRVRYPLKRIGLDHPFAEMLKWANPAIYLIVPFSPAGKNPPFPEPPA